MTPELALSPDEARRLATAAVEVQRHYPMPALDPGKVAVATLVWTAGSIYWPRIRALGSRTRRRTPDAPAAPAGNVVPMAPVTASSADWLGAGSHG